jgi:hypothetical protein
MESGIHLAVNSLCHVEFASQFQPLASLSFGFFNLARTMPCALLSASRDLKSFGRGDLPPDSECLAGVHEPASIPQSHEGDDTAAVNAAAETMKSTG